MPTSALPKVTTYEFRELMGYSGVTRNRLIRWLDAGIITAAESGDGTGSRRKFSFRNLVEAAVCDELAGLDVREPQMRRVVEALNAIWDQPDAPLNWRAPDGPKHRDAEVLWCAFQRHITPKDEPPTVTLLNGGRITVQMMDVTEGVRIYPVVVRDLIERLTTGDADGSGIAETGIAIPLARIIAELQAKTGGHTLS